MLITHLSGTNIKVLTIRVIVIFRGDITNWANELLVISLSREEKNYVMDNTKHITIFIVSFTVMIGFGFYIENVEVRRNCIIFYDLSYFNNVYSLGAS